MRLLIMKKETWKVNVLGVLFAKLQPVLSIVHKLGCFEAFSHVRTREVYWVILWSRALVIRIQTMWNSDAQ